MESEQIYSTLQAELASVQSKVNSWSLNKEKELQQLKSSHTAFLDSHNGASSPAAPCSKVSTPQISNGRRQRQG
jgi:hypothetical protein